MIQRNYIVVEEFPQSISNDYASMSRCAILHPNAWKFYAAAVQMLMQMRDNIFLYHLEILIAIEIAFDWYKDIVFTISPVFSSQKLNLQQMFKLLSEDRENQPIVSYCKSGTKALKQEFIKPPVASHLHQ